MTLDLMIYFILFFSKHLEREEQIHNNSSIRLITEAVTPVSAEPQGAGGAACSRTPRDGSSRAWVAQGCSSQGRSARGRGHVAFVTGGIAALWHGDSPGARLLGDARSAPRLLFPVALFIQ